MALFLQPVIALLALSLCSSALEASLAPQSHGSVNGEKRIMPQWADCTSASRVCMEGLTCAGGVRKRCVRPRNIGKKCGSSPFRACVDPLVCLARRCSLALFSVGVENTAPGAIRPSPSPAPTVVVVVPNGGDCDMPHTSCKDGAVCSRVYHPRRFICIRRRVEGEKCKYHAFAKCADGLVCVAGKCEPQGNGSY